MIVVTGATGTVGSELLRLLSARGVSVRALSRRPEAGERLAGVDWVAAELADRDGLADAFAGAEALFLVTGNADTMVRLQTNAIAAATRAGVHRVIKLSALGASDHSTSVIGLWHHNVERTLADSGLVWTSLRPHAFLQNLLDQADAIRAGRLYSAAGDGRVPFVDARDIAAVAAEVLVGGGWEGKAPVLTGPAALSFAQVADVLSEILGRRVVHVMESDDEAWARLRRAGQPPWLVAGQLALYGYQRAGGATAKVSDAVDRITGRPPRSVEEFVRDHRRSFAG